MSLLIINKRIMVFACMEEENETWEAFLTGAGLLRCWEGEGEMFNIPHQVPRGRLRASNPLLVNVYVLKRKHLKGE